MDNEKLTYTVKEVAQLLNLGLNKTYELVSNKNFPAIHVGRKIIIPKAALHRYLENCSNIHL